MKSYRVEIYNLDIANQSFRRLAEIITHKNLNYVEVKNGVGGCSFMLNIDDPKANATNLRRFINAVIIKEYDNDIIDDVGRVVWSGPITKVSGDYEDNSGYLTVEANTPLYHLMSRYTALKRIFSATDQASIAWTLISETQSQTNGWLGITQGSITTGTPRDRTYERGRVGDLLINLSELQDGFDFSFDPIVNSAGIFTGWQFNTYNTRMGSLREDLLPLELGENVQMVSFNTKDEIINYMTGVGSGTGEATLTSIQQSAGSQLGSTRRESFFTNKDVNSQTTLDEQTLGELNRKAAENFEVDLTLMPVTPLPDGILYDNRPIYGNFVLGDYLRLAINRGYMQLNYWALVKQISVRIDNEGVARVRPKLVII